MKNNLTKLMTFLVLAISVSCGKENTPGGGGNYGDLAIFWGDEAYTVEAGSTVAMAFTIIGNEGVALTVTPSVNDSEYQVRLKLNPDYTGVVTLVAPDIVLKKKNLNGGEILAGKVLKGMLMMNAKEFLRQIKKLDKMIENKLIEVQQWKSIANNTVGNMSADRVQTTPNHHKIADAIGMYIDLEREINQDIDKLVETKKEVISVIEQLNATEYDVLHKIYVQYLTFDEVALACHRTTSWATTVHGRALKHVQSILDQRNE